MDLETYMKLARNFKRQMQKREKQRENARIQLFLLLVELKSLDLVWRKFYETWDQFLQTEKPCSKAAFYRFEQALRLFGQKKIEVLGVTAASTLAMAPMTYRQKLMSLTEEWCREKNPNYAEVSRFVWEKRRELAPSKETVPKKELLEYIKVLQALLRKARIKIPPFP